MNGTKQQVSDGHGVYLLCFEQATGSDKHQAQHYLGSAKDVAARVEQHRKGQNCKRLTRYMAVNGIGFTVIRVWETKTVREARLLEAALKLRHGPIRLCPVHNEERKARRREQRLVAAPCMAQ